MHKNIPCIVNKCLLFPTCKHKKIIKCNELYKYIEQEMEIIRNNYNELKKFRHQLDTIFDHIEIVWPQDEYVPNVNSVLFHVVDSLRT